MQTKTAPAGMTVGPWMTDTHTYGPGAIVAVITYCGIVCQAKNLLGPGWPMTLKVDGRHFHMAGWENWSEVATKLDTLLTA